MKDWRAKTQLGERKKGYPCSAQNAAYYKNFLNNPCPIATIWLHGKQKQRVSNIFLLFQIKNKNKIEAGSWKRRSYATEINPEIDISENE